VPYQHRPGGRPAAPAQGSRPVRQPAPGDLLSGAGLDASSLKPEVVEGLDILIVRELTGGVYFGEPKEIVTLEDGSKRGVDTQLYTTGEIERICAASPSSWRASRNSRVSSAEKHNVMKTGVLWKRDGHAGARQELPARRALEHVLADNCAMQLVRWPKQYDVIVCDNLFGDILSDVAAMLTGSLGMLPSASLGAEDPATGKRQGAIYEPVHGSAPDIAGKGLANPIAMIGSFAMALRYSFGAGEAADRLEGAIADVLGAGTRTKDIAAPGANAVSTTEMGDAIVKALEARG
jgi:3-isopropylmalate dehydrogenase